MIGGSTKLGAPGTAGGFSAQANALFARVEKFEATTVAARAASWEFQDRAPNLPALREAAQLGLTGIEVERPQGGLGLGFREKVRVAEILSRSSMTFAFSVVNSQNVAASLSRLGAVAHRMELLPDLLSGQRLGATALTEPGAGSDLTALTTTAEQAGSGWRLNGEKAWITNGAMADVILCYGQTEPGSGAAGVACFVVKADRPGFTRSAPYDVVAGSTLGVGGFTLTDYEVADNDMIVGPGDGFTTAMAGVNGARIYVAAMCCSMVRSALSAACEYGTRRSTFGQSLLDHQGLSWTLVDVANRLEAAEALTARAVDAFVAGDHGDHLDEVINAAAHAKKFAAEMAEPALAACMQFMGAEGLRQTHPVGRHLAAARLAHYVDGTTQMQNERLSRGLLDRYGPSANRSGSIASPDDLVIDLSEGASSGPSIDRDPSEVPGVGDDQAATSVEDQDPAESESDDEPIAADEATSDPAPPSGETDSADGSPASPPAVESDSGPPAMPPLPGEEHRLDPPITSPPPEEEPVAGTPPLPPDSLRRVD